MLFHFLRCHLEQRDQLTLGSHWQVTIIDFFSRLIAFEELM